MEKNYKYEYCSICGSPTEKVGEGCDSIYIISGLKKICPLCYDCKDIIEKINATGDVLVKCDDCLYAIKTLHDGVIECDKKVESHNAIGLYAWWDTFPHVCEMFEEKQG